jgi:DnaJ-class molecular chaperone
VDLDKQLDLERNVKRYHDFDQQKPMLFDIPCEPCKGRGWFALDMMGEDTVDCKYCKGTGLVKDAFTK